MCSGDMQQLQNHNWHTIKHSSENTSQRRGAAVNSCFVQLKGAEAGACIGGAQQGQPQIAHIHSQLQPLHDPRTWSRSQILFHTIVNKLTLFIHTSGNVAGSIVRSSQQAQNLFTHTHSQLQLLRVPGTCSRRVSPCLIASCHTISHRFNLSVSCGRTPSTCLHCKKSPFSNIRCWNMRMKFDQMNFGGTCCSDKTSVLQLRMYVRNLMLSLLRVSDTGACFSPLRVNKTGIDRRSTSLRRVLAAVLNRLCQLWFCSCCMSPLHMPVKCVPPIQAPASAPLIWKKQELTAATRLWDVFSLLC